MKELGDALSGQTQLPAKTVILTFDDGYRDFYDNVFPLLKKYQYKATIYIIYNFIDIRFNFDDAIQLTTFSWTKFNIRIYIVSQNTIFISSEHLT